MSQIRELALKKSSIKESLLDAVSPVKVTLADNICVYCAEDVPPWSSTQEFYP